MDEERERRSMSGARSRAAGALFEKMVAAGCAAYLRDGAACIEKTPEPMKVLRPYGGRGTGQFVSCYASHAQPDFKGALRGGACVIFDAKHTDKDRIRQEAVTEGQREAFDRYEAVGARCFVVVSVALASFYRVPWGTWKRMKELFGHKYMREGAELAPYVIPCRGGAVLFLEGIEE